MARRKQAAPETSGFSKMTRDLEAIARNLGTVVLARGEAFAAEARRFAERAPGLASTGLTELRRSIDRGAAEAKKEIEQRGREGVRAFEQAVKVSREMIDEARNAAAARIAGDGGKPAATGRSTRKATVKKSPRKRAAATGAAAKKAASKTTGRARKTTASAARSAKKASTSAKRSAAGTKGAIKRASTRKASTSKKPAAKKSATRKRSTASKSSNG